MVENSDRGKEMMNRKEMMNGIKIKIPFSISASPQELLRASDGYFLG